MPLKPERPSVYRKGCVVIWRKRSVWSLILFQPDGDPPSVLVADRLGLPMLPLAGYEHEAAETPFPELYIEIAQLTIPVIDIIFERVGANFQWVVFDDRRRLAGRSRLLGTIGRNKKTENAGHDDT